MSESGTEQIVSGAATDCVHILNYKVPKKDLAWGLAVTVLGIVCFSLIIALAIQSGGGGSSGGVEKTTTCTNSACLGASAAFTRNMDTTVNPCNNFYQYVCGNFAANHAIPPDGNARGTYHDMTVVMDHALYGYLEKPIERVTVNSYEVKLKNLFHSCMNEELTEMRGGQPLIDAIEKAGGWNVFALKEGQSQNWTDYNNLLHNLMADLWSFPFMRFDVFPDPTNRNKRVLSIDPSGIGMSKKWFLGYESVETQEAYKTYIRGVANQLLMENDMQGTDNVEAAMELFTKDAYDVEEQIAQIMSDTATDMTRHVTLDELEPADGGFLDVIGLATEIFADAGLNSQSMVYTKPSYVMAMDGLIADILYDEEGGSRKLNNYIIWRLMDQYSQVLSREYRLAKRDFLTELTGTEEEWSRWIDCINLIKMRMPQALSAITALELKDKLNRPDIEGMVTSLQQALKVQLQEQTFADKATVDMLTEKTDLLHLELYDDHDFVVDPVKTDVFFEKLTIHTGGLFENVLFLNMFVRDKLNEILPSESEDHPMFVTPEYSVLPRYSEIWNHLYIPLASLSYPLYHQDLPAQVKYGALGYTAGLTTANMINIMGSGYNKDGVVGSWWSQSSYVNYERQMQCFHKLYNNTEFGPYEVDGPMRTVKLPSTMVSAEVVQEIAGLRNAYLSYQEHMIRDHTQPELLAGLDHDVNQLFFISYAHSHCVTRRDRWEYDLVTDNMIPEEFRTNEAVSQMAEFQGAFQCPADSKMVQSNGCTPPL